MRVTLTHAYSWPEVRRGAERVLHELGAALVKRGNEVTVLTAGSKAGRSTHRGVTTIRYRRVFDRRARHEAEFGLRIVPALVARGSDVVHSLGPFDAVGALRAARLRGHRRYRTVYTNVGLPLRQHWKSKPSGRAHDRVTREVDAYGCMSRAALELYAADYGKQGVLTPGGVDLTRFAPAPSRAPDPTILFSAALDRPEKGGETLVEAFGVLLREEPSARLWLSGPGDPQRLLRFVPSPVRDRIDVLGMGSVDDQPERYGRAWVTALPSRNESFGLAVVESLACGTPVAAADHAALPELIEDGKTGALCEHGDVRSVTRALAHALALSRESDIVQRCRASAEPYDWFTGIAPLYEAVYRGGP